MVLFLNINIGQRVEVYYKGQIFAGTVKYKGGLSNIKGDWVGVHLDEPVGKHSGIFKGREYFTCTPKHGIFIHPSRIRFTPLKRNIFDTYRTVSPGSYVDETLFGAKSVPKPIGLYDPVSVSDTFVSLATAGFNDPSASWHAGKKCLSKSESFSCSSSPSFSHSHSVGRTLKPERPKSAMELSGGSWGRTKGGTGRCTSPLRRFYSRADSPFISRPAVPKTHMPTEALQLQDMRGWSCTSKPREWSL
ncbi:dynactin subunit 1-like [Patiria miniata]|uniref:CAP-Gly domain-containing protein n=1 Tax=Patiria miniata TaxID=46514 RepID=A0A913ZHF3_PATMI|nr:dynactin subunit 1-like [Patiria miniata]XP_038050460.1 dynactin subunit 1-like [Patiria miniata]